MSSNRTLHVLELQLGEAESVRGASGARCQWWPVRHALPRYSHVLLRPCYGCSAVRLVNHQCNQSTRQALEERRALIRERITAREDADQALEGEYAAGS